MIQILQQKVPAASAMPNKLKRQVLPDDIMYEILERLPVRTLIRFKCVCKFWCSLISSPHFQKNHYLHSQKKPLLLTLKIDGQELVFESHFASVRWERTCIRKFSKKVTPPINFTDYLYFQPCLGLVCFSWLFNNRIFILNPSTEELISLPPTKKRDHFAVGFGHLSSTNEFKVVSLGYKNESSFYFEVFTLGTSGWREVSTSYNDWREVSTSYNNFAIGGAPFVHGALHFLPTFDEEVDKYCIVTFDVGSEKCNTIRFPERYYTDFGLSYCRPKLKKLGDSLCLSFIFFRSNEVQELWRLKDYENGGWVKEYIIDPFTLTGDIIDPFNIVMDPLLIMEDGSLLMKVTGPYPRRKILLLCYDPKQKIVTRKIGEDCGTAIYGECLTSLQ